MNIKEYTSKFLNLIQKERTAENEFHINEIKNTTPFIREKKGRAITNVIKQKIISDDEQIFRFTKQNSSEFFINDFQIGSNVIISIKNPLEEGLKGTVTKITKTYIDIKLNRISNIIKQSCLRIDLYVNDTTYETQKNILNNMKNWSFEQNKIKEILLYNSKPTLDTNTKITHFFDDTLNESQKIATTYALKEKEFYLIQGPPGTGKTKTSIEIIRQHLAKNKTILVCADSNTAVDNIMSGLLKHTLAIRIGNSPKIDEQIQNHTLTQVIKQDIKFTIMQQYQEQIKDLKKAQQNYTIPNKKNSNNLSYFQIKSMASRGQSGFNLSSEKIASMAKWIVSQEKIKNNLSKIDKLKKELIKKHLKSASVICTTNTNASSEYLANITFDLVLIDEAAQSTEPSCLIPISKSKKVILVGDHKQLPPTILSENAKELSISLFERMLKNSRYVILDTQYRMNPLINEFPSNEFYSGLIKSHDSTKNNLSTQQKNVVFYDINGEQKIKSKSYYNNEEIDFIMQLLSDLIKKHKINASDIGIISPYSEQVKHIKSQTPFIDVNSIDGFQGKEKNIIIISLVRTKGLGFLKDLRRLNVALTRAKNELIVIGNSKNLIQNETYKKFIDFVRKKGIYKKII